MRGLPEEPDDVEFFVGGVEPDATLDGDAAKYIEEYKKRPDYPRMAQEAERILSALGINPRPYGMQDAKSLLKHWHQCIADLREADDAGTDDRLIDRGFEAGSGIPTSPRNRPDDAPQ